MSSNFEDEIEELMQRASGLEHGPEEIALIEEAVRLADAHQRLDYGFDLRKRLMLASTFGGAPEKALVAFTWCIAQCDREPDEFDSGELLWEYKWVVSGLKQFPQITLQQIDTAAEDMTQRYQQAGLSLRPIYKLRSLLAMHRGDIETCREWQRLWRKSNTGYGNDCEACELHDQFEFLVFVGKDERAIEMAQPILNNRMRCAEIPHLTYAHVLMPFLRLDQRDEAMSAHKRGYRMIATNREFLSSVGEHITFLELSNNRERALELIEKHLSWMLETSSLLRRFEFNLGSLLVLQGLDHNAKTTVKLDLPRNFPPYQADHQYPVQAIRDWFEADCRGIADQFDRRNQTDHFTRRIDELVKLRQWERDWPID